MTNKIRDGIETLRATGAALHRMWRSKPKGEQLRKHLDAVERTRSEAAVDALIEFLVRMQLVSDHLVLRDVLAAAEAMMMVPPKFDIRPVPRPGGFYSIGPGLEMQELTAEEAAEIAALGPDHSSGDECAICAVMEKHRRKREARASAAGN